MNLSFDETELKRILEAVMTEALARIRADMTRLGGRLGFTEPEAAAAIGVAPHVLRDCRLRGEIGATKIGRRWVYSRESLLRLLGERGSR